MREGWRAWVLCGIVSTLAAPAACNAVLDIREYPTLDEDAGAPDGHVRDATSVDAAETGDPTDATNEADAWEAPDAEVPDAAPDTSPSPSFALTLDVASVNIVRGGSAQVNVTASRGGGFSGAITVSVKNLPTDVSADALVLNSGVPTGKLTLRAKNTAVLGVYTNPVVSGADGSVTSPAVALGVVVQDKAGTLDTTFGTNGIATIQIPGATGSALGNHGLAVEPGGFIVFSGNVNDYNLLVGRLTPDGKLDTSFAGTGFSTSNPLSVSTAVGEAIKPLPSGGLVVGGFARPTGGSNRMFLAKLFESGFPDTTFANGAGFVAIDVGGVDSKAGDLMLQSDGKLVLSGFEPYGTSALVRLTSDGVADPAFDPAPVIGGTIGVKTFPDAGNQINSLALLPDGAFLASIESTSSVGVRFTSTGEVDGAYGSGGAVSNSAAPIGAVAVVLQPSGYAVYVGSTATTIEAVRFTPTGQLDGSFGIGGHASTAIPGSSSVQVYSAAAMPDGRFVVGVQLATNTPIGLVRYGRDGKLDTSFASVGYTGISGAAQGGTEPVAVDAVGRILVAAAAGGIVEVARFWP